ncbi:MAG TPA: hypothetical protein VFK38_08970, partial [Candidatus Limnocylindrales bacterium]|nr:hypothetical protein [Candidatus Limnocylindrales bacterium]
MSRSDGPVPTPLTTALARLESRWGSAAVRLGSGERPDGSGWPGLPARIAAHPPVEGALAPALAPLPEPGARPGAHPLAPLADDIVSTGFPELDAILGTGGLPRQASATIRGDASSGKT